MWKKRGDISSTKKNHFKERRKSHEQLEEVVSCPKDQPFSAGEGKRIDCVLISYVEKWKSDGLGSRIGLRKKEAWD